MDRALERDLAAFIEPGSTVVVHSSLKSVGWADEGAAAVVRALVAAVGERGDLAMPAATPQCDQERFDRAATKTTLGAIPEAFRTWPGTLRSDHPLESVCARGPCAADITRAHPLAFSEGPGSPFAAIHDLDARILLLGVGFNRCTALHFAESLSPKRRTKSVRFRLGDGWGETMNVADDLDTHFPAIGAEFTAGGGVAQYRVGDARALYLSMRDLVTFALNYFDREF